MKKKPEAVDAFVGSRSLYSAAGTKLTNPLVPPDLTKVSKEDMDLQIRRLQHQVYVLEQEIMTLERLYHAEKENVKALEKEKKNVD